MESLQRNPESDPVTSLIRLSEEVEAYKPTIEKIRAASSSQNHREILMFDKLVDEINGLMARAAETTSEVTNQKTIPVTALKATFNQVKAGINNPEPGREYYE